MNEVWEKICVQFHKTKFNYHFNKAIAQFQNAPVSGYKIIFEKFN